MMFAAPVKAEADGDWAAIVPLELEDGTPEAAVPAAWSWPSVIWRTGVTVATEVGAWTWPSVIWETTGTEVGA